MDDQELNRIADAWVAAEEAGPDTSDYERNWWAVSRVMDWALHGQADLLWRFVVVTYPRDLSARTVAVLAAGPLEDLLSKHGPEYIARVEELARTDDRFNDLLGGVWRLSMTDDVWARVQAARRTVW